MSLAKLSHIKCCCFDESRLTVGAVPQFKPSKLKEFSETKNQWNIRIFVLLEVIKSVRININNGSESSICLLVNCCTCTHLNFNEVEEVFLGK